jgi:hypothetical protein
MQSTSTSDHYDLLVKIVDLNSFNFMELVSQVVYFTLVVLGNGNGRKCNNCANFYYGGIE